MPKYKVTTTTLTEYIVEVGSYEQARQLALSGEEPPTYGPWIEDIDVTELPDDKHERLDY